ncbi:hypothetical protein GGI13_003962 [Coemansia sp. RSA 455]|nr:hypothetical protein GGI09_001566 [Coemansia sp. S100]KAJ2111229.1 hypothetical protein IW146_005507 [Coemansia sp. RSA 922]KAJ2250865.1 hypothetical protein GGI13_003962 [Coemansia sp. RSA 455]
MASVEDSWVVVDKTASGTLRAKASHESLYASDDDADLGAGARIHVRADRPGAAALAPELMDWLNNAASESSTALPLANRNSSTSKCSYRTNSSSAASRQNRSSRRSSISDPTDTAAECSSHRCSSASLEAALDPLPTQGTFVVKVVEVRQVGATRPMNLQCAAQVADERFVIPHVMTRPKDYNTWSAKMDDTFVFDVSRQFTFNLSVYATAVAPVRPVGLPHRLSMATRRVGRNSIASDSAPSLASNSSTKTTAKIRAGIRRIFGNRPGEADAAYTGFTATGGVAALGSDHVVTAEATDDQGRRIEVQQHASALDSMADLSSALPNERPVPARVARLSTLLPRARTSTVVSAAAAFGRGRAASSASAASAMTNGTTCSATAAQPVGELFLDLRVERREKRRATFILPAVNQEQVAMRGGAHVEMAVVLEFGVIVHETLAERQRRLQRAEAAEAAQQRAVAEQQWDAADENDRAPRLRSPLSVFTRSGRLSTWRRYWAELSASHVLFFDSETDVDPAASVPLLHLAGAGVPSSDLVSIGPGGIELRLSSLAMTDRHRRTSAFPRPNVDRDRDRTLTAATMAAHRDDDDLDAFADWQCRVYLLLDTLAERDRWLNELTSVAVPSAENARKRMQQRRIAAAAELASNTESLRQSGKHVAVKALEKMSMAQTAYAKKVFVDSASGHRVISLSSAQVPDIDATLTENVAVRKPVAMAFGKPATFSLTISPDVAHPPPPAKKRLRARRRSNSVADMRNTHKPSDDESFKPLRRKGSGASTVLEVVGKAMERRPGTVSRRFLFVWNINEI